MFQNQNLEKNKNMFWNILGPNLTGQSPLKKVNKHAFWFNIGIVFNETFKFKYSYDIICELYLWKKPDHLQEDTRVEDIIVAYFVYFCSLIFV